MGIHEPVDEECRRTYQQPDAKEAKNFGVKYGNGRNITERENYHGKELQVLEEGYDVEIQLESLRAIPKKSSELKTPGHDDIHGYWFKNFTLATTDWPLN